mmetsp:Transcript_17600/g.22842  ORF Transcript_17600/g.22842 Transcript_17600/m.22842 type:complete len:87 (-) Transcript_17600:996-1256(-)
MILDKKIAPLSDSNTLGQPYLQKNSLIKYFAIIYPVSFGSANSSGHLVKKSVKTKIYLFFFFVSTRGPTYPLQQIQKLPKLVVLSK